MSGWSSPTPTESTKPLGVDLTPVVREGGFSSAFASMRGIAHRVNEDCCLHFPSDEDPVCCVVADGVGGGAFGEVASHALAQHCAAAEWEVYREPDRLVEWIKQGDRVVAEAIALRGERPGASTLVVAWFLPSGSMHISNIGDCRAYRLRCPAFRRNWRIEQITTDQTYANLGRIPPPGGNPHDPACMAGVGAVGEPVVLPERLKESELLLLCSDGLHKFVADAGIAALVGDGMAEELGLREICQRLVDAAKANGSHDDISALLVRKNPRRGAGLGYWLALLATLGLAVSMLAYRSFGSFH